MGETNFVRYHMEASVIVMVYLQIATLIQLLTSLHRTESIRP